MYRRLSGRRASLVNALAGHLRSKLLLGVLLLIPLAVTFVVLSFIFNGLDGLVQPLVDIIFGREIVGVGIGMTAAAVYLAGLLASSRVGRAIIRWVEVGILRIPVVSWIYHIVKDITDALSAVGKVSSRVVMVEWPKAGTYTIGFLTKTMVKDDGKTYHSVLIPTTPTPQTGLLAIMPDEEVTFTDLSVEEGIKLVVSSGILAPDDLMNRIGTAARGGAMPVKEPGEESLAEAARKR